MRSPDCHHEFAERDDSQALAISKGTAEQNILNPDLSAVIARRKRREPTLQELFDGVRSGDRAWLGKAITLVESSLPKHQELAQELVQMCLPYTGNSLRVGITGVPGAGKSSFIESFGVYLHDERQCKLAVLAIDPTSQRTHGSILGDKTRMVELSCKADVFIRPSPSGSSLGGVAQKTRESVLLCEAAGYTTIFIETVGVGQSETTVHGMVDFFLLLMLAGAGDELQGIKRGIMEMCDGMAITKCDGSNVNRARAAKTEYQTALHMFPATAWNWAPKVLTSSAVTREGLPEIWDMIQEYTQQLKENGWWLRKRTEQLRNWMTESIHDRLISEFYANADVAGVLKATEDAVVSGKESPFHAADRLLKLFRKS